MVVSEHTQMLLFSFCHHQALFIVKTKVECFMASELTRQKQHQTCDSNLVLLENSLSTQTPHEARGPAKPLGQNKNKYRQFRGVLLPCPQIPVVTLHPTNETFLCKLTTTPNKPATCLENKD